MGVKRRGVNTYLVDDNANDNWNLVAKMAPATEKRLTKLHALVADRVPLGVPHFYNGVLLYQNTGRLQPGFGLELAELLRWFGETIQNCVLVAAMAGLVKVRELQNIEFSTAQDIFAQLLVLMREARAANRVAEGVVQQWESLAEWWRPRPGSGTQRGGVLGVRETRSGGNDFRSVFFPPVAKEPLHRGKGGVHEYFPSKGGTSLGTSSSGGTSSSSDNKNPPPSVDIVIPLCYETGFDPVGLPTNARLLFYDICGAGLAFFDTHILPKGVGFRALVYDDSLTEEIPTGEVVTYFYHMFRQYDTLADVTLFLHPDYREHTRSNLMDRLAASLMVRVVFFTVWGILCLASRRG